ncbi:hypothetical protein ES703_118060 [subsurface metagenome]
MEFTLVKSDLLSIGAAADGETVLDLGLAIGEVARILGVFLSVEPGCATAASGAGTVGLSFDPEDTGATLDAAYWKDDDVFAKVHQYIMQQADGGAAHEFGQFFDFTGMNLITARNIAYCGKSVTNTLLSHVVLYYEKKKPTPNDMNAIIGYRR